MKTGKAAAQQAEDSVEPGPFITGMLFGGSKKPNQTATSVSSTASKPGIGPASRRNLNSRSKVTTVADERYSEVGSDDQEELKDEVYDFGNALALQERADDYLLGRDPIKQFLALPPSEGEGRKAAVANWHLEQRPKKCDNLTQV